MTASAPIGMRFLAGGRFLMGADRFYPEERPRRAAEVGAFWIDETPVTNAMFAAFVAATGHRTLAERAPDPAFYPNLRADLRQPGSLVFQMTGGPVDLAQPGTWWRFVAGADWRHPQGPESSLDGLADHPAVHIAREDAAAYAAWAGKALPTEAEWEFAARGGLADADYAWGDELAPGGRSLANIWEGEFPWRRRGTWQRTSPVRSFPPNAFGLFDMIGNVWEWTQDCFATPGGKPGCCTPDGDPGERFTIKGGSHLCAESYCQRYRPAARQGQSAGDATSHIGFRCVLRPA